MTIERASNQEQALKHQEKGRAQDVVHPILPTFDEHAKVLILGSFPSVKSREMGYFYGHPQNRFWKVLSALYGKGEEEKADALRTAGQRRSFLLRHHIAVWDVIASCTITGSADSSIRNVKPNNLEDILLAAPIEQIFVNGQKAGALYDRYIFPETGRTAIVLPSTSPANAAWSLERLIERWGMLLDPCLRGGQ